MKSGARSKTRSRNSALAAKSPMQSIQVIVERSTISCGTFGPGRFSRSAPTLVRQRCTSPPHCELQEDDPQQMRRLTTVDINDVNDQATSPWLKYGSPYSPVELAQRLGLNDRITFVTGKSLEFFASCSDQYDLIFLDGDHTASTVYREIPAALVQLRREGVILLHDYFPALQPLWPGETVISGPWLATERLRSEGAEFMVIPLGELPWPTKLGSRITSLALLVGG